MNKIIDIIIYIYVSDYSNGIEMTNARLTKTIYLCDWRHAFNFSCQITDIKWYYDHYGPYVTDVKEVIEKDDNFDIKLNPYHKKIYTLNNYKNLDLDKLSLNENEKETIDYVLKRTQSLGFVSFKKLVYNTYPVKVSDQYTYLNLTELAINYRSL